MDSSKNSKSFMDWFFGKQTNIVPRLFTILQIVVFLYFVSLSMGYFLGTTFSYDIIDDIVENVPDLVTDSFTTTFLNLLLHNIQASFISVITGFFLGIPPFLLVAFNGFVLGVIVQSASSSIGFITTLLLLAPHGIFEIFATLLSSALGAVFGYTLIERLRGRDSVMAIINYIFNMFLKRVIPLLIIAALIETWLIFFTI